MRDLVTAIGLVLVIEGLLYGAFPGTARRMAEMLEQTPEDMVRYTGLAVALGGFALVWFTKST